MYSYEERKRAVELYIKYNNNMATVTRELGYPSRGMLYNWYKEFCENGDLRSYAHHGYSKYTDEQRKQAVEYYLEHGRSVSRTIKALGFPKNTTLREWVQADLPDDEDRCVASKTLVRYTEEQKEQAVIRFCAGEGSAKEIAAEIGATESSLRRWRDELLSERCCAKVPYEYGQKANGTTDDFELDKGKKYNSCRHLPIDESASKNETDLANEKQTLTQQVEELKQEVHRLQLERDILEKAGEILKKARASIQKH